MDGVGEWATTSLGVGSGSKVELIKEIRFPHSLGMLYSAFTYYLGFKVNDGEYKVMGLAPYGEPKYTQQIYDDLIDLKPDGSFRMDMQYFNYCTGLTMTNERFDRLFGAPARNGREPLTQREMDIARSVQAVIEEVILRLCRSLRAETGMTNLCMAGGVALNCVANGRILREGPFDDLWVQPAAGDAGGAVGVAQAISFGVGGLEPQRNGKRADGMSGSYLGPAFDEARVVADLEPYGAVYHRHDDASLFSTVAAALADEKVVGWFQDRMEFGPRALGNRSILGDPRSVRMQRMLNLKIKYRESFRPFAPAVLREDVSEYFGLDGDSPYMLLVAPVREERRRMMESVTEFSRNGGPVVGICNGFQVLTEAGLLPGALQKNAGLKFLCTTVGVRVETADSVLTRNAEIGQELALPINHFEGNYTCSAETLAVLNSDDRVVLRYLDNPNGSMDDIAGICSEGRNVVGLMPHPERACDELLGSSDGRVLLGSLIAP